MKSICILIVMILSLPSWATVVARTSDCPVQFEGKIKEIIEPVGPSDVFSMNKVLFENLRTLKGDVGEEIQLDILQNGPFKIEADREYRVQIRSGKLCWIEEI